MNIAAALTIALGLPAYLVLDLLHRGVSPAAILASEDSLLAEYQNAHGYAYDWGNIIEARTPAALAWHFAPVELWRGTDQLRQSPEQTTLLLIPRLQHVVVAALRERLPAELVLVGCHPQSRRHSHVLFSLVLLEPGRERDSRRWLAAAFLPSVLPDVLGRVRAELIALCRPPAAGE